MQMTANLQFLSAPPKFIFSKAGDGKEHKFWNLKAQISQIKHHNFDTIINALAHHGGATISPAAPN